MPLFIPNMSTNVTHFPKHMNKMIQTMDSPEASVTSLWEMLTSSPWWNTILIVIILIVLFLLFVPCICNCIGGFLSSHMEVFKVTNGCSNSCDYYLGPLDQRPSI